MKTKLPTGRVQYAESKVDWAEQWLRDHREAQACQDFELVVRDMNVLMADILDVDTQLQNLYLDGLAESAEFSGRVESLFHRWLSLAQRFEAQAREFESKGYEVEGVAGLRKGIDEFAAVVRSSDGFGGKMIELRDGAIAAHDRGDSTEGLRD